MSLTKKQLPKIAGAVLLGIALAFGRNLTFIFQTESIPYLVHALYGFSIGLLLKYKPSQLTNWFVGSLILFLVLMSIPNFYRDELTMLIPMVITFCIGYFARKTWLKSFLFLSALAITWISVNAFYHGGAIKTYAKACPEQIFKFVNHDYHFFPEDDGQVKVVELWFVHCKPCRKQLRFMESFSMAYRSNPNVAFYTFNIANDPEEQVVELLSDLNVNPTVGMDTTGYFKNLTGLSAYPQLLVIDRKNQLRFVYHGFSEDRMYHFKYWLDDAIDELASEALQND